MKKIIPTGIAAALALTGFGFVGVAPAVAADDTTGTTVIDQPATPTNTTKLPLVHIKRNGPLKANIINPHPSCNAWEDYRTVITRVRNSFEPVGTVQTSNHNAKEAITTSMSVNRSKSVTLAVSGDIGGSYKGVNLAIHPSISYTASWSVGQSIGPVTIPAGSTATAVYGFNMVHFDGFQQRCLVNGKWSAPWRYFGSGPSGVAARVQVSPSDVDPAILVVDNNSNPNEAPLAAIDPNTPVVDPSQANPEYDLAPSLQVSALKAPGFTGRVALKVKNVGKKYYPARNNAIQFRVDVKTVSGPTDVDRLMRMDSMSGASVQDYGFNGETGVRSFIVTLNNNVEVGQTQTLGSIWFGDGLTGLGRIVQDIEVTQVTRVNGDNSNYNDFLVKSENVTKSDFGRALPGLF